MRVVLSCLLPSLLLTNPCVASTPDAGARQASPAVAPLAIGDTFTVESKALGETRRVNVYLPAAYRASDDARLPVLYLLDGGVDEDFLHIAGLVQVLSGNGGMRPVILVGIENTQRRRDYTVPTQDSEDRAIALQVGGSDAFRMFLRDELIPRIEARYRTTDENGVVGESLAGLLVIETLAREPALFDRHIAIDPSLWLNRNALVDTASQWIEQAASHPVSVHVSSGREASESPSMPRFLQTLRTQAPSSWRVAHAPLPQETHATVFHPAARQALRAVFKPADPER